MIVTIKDETFAGKLLQEITLEFSGSTATVKDIIAERVLKEVALYNNRLPEYFHGLVQPAEAERTLNGYKLEHKKLIDGEKQVYVALHAFTKNAYFVLIDNIQADSLEQIVSLSQHTSISFIKLTPLVGG